MVELSVEPYSSMVEVSVESYSAMVEVSVEYSNYYSLLYSTIKVFRYTRTSSMCCLKVEWFTILIAWMP